MMHNAAPQNIEAEQSLLGSILLNNEVYDHVSHVVDEADFYEQVHGLIFTAIAKRLRGGQSANPVTIKDLLPPDLGDDLTMSEYLARLCTSTPSLLNGVDYARVIKDLSTKRRMLSAFDGMSHAILEGDERDATELLEEAEQQLFSLSVTGRERGGFRAFGDAVQEAVEMTAAAYRTSDGLSGLPTGLDDLDRMLGGLHDTDLVILAARPGMGKTSLATNIAFTTAKANKSVGFFSLEMSRSQLALRILSERSELSSSDLRRGNIHESQFTSVMNASREISDLPLFIDDAGGQGIHQICATARRLKRTKGLDLVVVDYLQLLSGSGRRGIDNRVQELTEITTGLKALAKELHVPVLALSQLSRQVENREDKRPLLSDLRESGSIEQDADVVMFIYREEYYLKNREPQEGTPEHLSWQESMQRVSGLAEIIISKQRHGPTGTVPVHFDASLTKFSNIARPDYLAERRA